MNEIQEQVRLIRSVTGLSQNRFAEKFHIPPATLKDWEHGRRKPPEYVIYMLKELILKER